MIEAAQSYPEVDIARLAVQLPMFRSSYEHSSVEEAVSALQSSSHEIKQLFSEVEQLLRLLLSSCEAERSFSSLRRLKTYLRSTMTQSRLNSIAILHVHQHELMAVPLEHVLIDFVCLSSTRIQTFGSV